MNKTAIKNFAIWARNKLISDINYRAGLLGIAADGIHSALPQSTGQTQFYDIGTAEPYAITGEQILQRQHLVDLLRQKEKESDYRTAYKYVLEEVAYTWFNRLIAVRFMEVNDYLPSHIRVLSSESGKMEPDLVTTPFDADLEFTRDEQQTILDLKNASKLDEVFRLLFIKQCNALNEILPALFEKTNDYTELLLNLSVIDQDGVVYHLVHDIPEEDFDVERGGQVEIIGWLYQYYNTEPKENAFNAKGKITKEELPFVTQLFTPDWIVRYMVENCVGKIWINHLKANNPGISEKQIAKDYGWDYYIANAETEIYGENEKKQSLQYWKNLTPQDITCFDPAMGSGHILVCAFEVLLQIYESVGYSNRDAARSIVENNLYGADIDERAFQLAYFAVIMKARQFNRRILRNKISPNLFTFTESNGINRDHLHLYGLNMNQEMKSKAIAQINELIDLFEDAKEYGSAIPVITLDWNLLNEFIDNRESKGQTRFETIGLDETTETIKKLIKQAYLLDRKYNTIITNPPYLGSGNMEPKLSAFVKKEYFDYKTDLFSVFIFKCSQMLKMGGYAGYLSPYVWMFISAYEKLRNNIYSNYAIKSLIQFEYSAFESATVPLCTFIIQKTSFLSAKGCYIRLSEFRGGMEIQRIKTLEAINDHNCGYYYEQSTDAFYAVPGRTVAYWASEGLFDAFTNGMPLIKVARTRQGLATTNNELFLRLWQEVDIKRIGFNCSNPDDALKTKKKWFPVIKGGDYRRWYGNNYYVINYENNGKTICDYIDNTPGVRVKSNGRVINREHYFKGGMTWGTVTSGKLSMRHMMPGSVYEHAGGTIPLNEWGDKEKYLLGLMNSSVAMTFLEFLSPTLRFTEGPVGDVPIILNEGYYTEIASLVDKCESITKADWDSKECSWEFTKNPLTDFSREQFLYEETHQEMNRNLVSDMFYAWKKETCNRFRTLKECEEKINALFTEIYNLKNTTKSSVDDNSISISVADERQMIIDLISYAVGCMMGRYSVDQDGILFAGGEWNAVDKTQAMSISRFLPDSDNIIPLTDEEYLEDDIVSQFCTWIKVVYGEGTLEENLDYIAKVLGNKGDSSRKIIRNYFLNEFFKDHCQIYSVTGSGKRPIYWLFDSGKQNGFKALIYLHRYNADTIGNLRIDYLHRMQRIYESEISRMQDMIDHSTNAREVAQAAKRREKLTKQLKECREYDEKLAHLALSRIELDLDDGVKVNYRKLQTASDGKFYEVLADSKNIMSKK